MPLLSLQGLTQYIVTTAHVFIYCAVALAYIVINLTNTFWYLFISFSGNKLTSL